MTDRSDVLTFFVYGEPSRVLDVGFLHVETVMERKSLHFGRVAPHKHPFMGQITYWLTGEGRYQIEDRTWNFSAPAISFVPSNVVHGFAVGEQSDAIVVSISDDLLRAMAAQVDLTLDTPVLITGEADAPAWRRIAVLLDMVMEEYRGGATASERMLASLVGAVLSLMARLGGNVGFEAASPVVALGLELRRTIDRHYREDWPVGHYVERLATTPHLLDKAARAVFGQTVKEMVLERRLLQAKRLLRFTIRPMEDIGREIGFEDPAYFSRFFRKRMGLSPTDWRRQNSEATGDG
ncbi:helix-turn-helix domain-containing protein [Shinella kummerowiae]|uniref:helix-turn-helix domain-containing protein n=1 Tax=Shinella kummerowiae TaxID=417745 RepID=UPI0021B61902|nr:helix-turn-helix domain-containing protein [Shinella kummerowiae]MCT7666898.1 helix-turn-helix domain-containing protein [Shinella kummerowiae]